MKQLISRLYFICDQTFDRFSQSFQNSHIRIFETSESRYASKTRLMIFLHRIMNWLSNLDTKRI